MRLFDLFKRKKPEPKFKGRVIDYHEDDFCRIELLPSENDSVKTLNRKISITEIEKILTNSSLKKFDNVTTGYGSNKYDSEYSTAYGEEGCVLIYERRNDLIDHIWLKYLPAWTNEQNRSDLCKCLIQICKTWDLILVDHIHGLRIDPNNKMELEKYLRRLHE